MVRVDPDGATVVAGQVAPGAKVSLRVDGAEVAATTADNAGKFVAIFTLPQAGAGRLMTLVETLPDGSTVEAGTVVALMGTTAPAPPSTTTATATDTTAADATQTAAAPAATDTAAAPAPQTTTAALAVTDQGAKVLQPATAVPPEVAANVTLDTIAYPSADTVQFGGHGKAGTFIRLYLNNAALGDAVTVGEDGTWAETQTSITPGLYTLRVDQMDAAGKVTSRFETPFKRETAEALAAASGTKPATTAASDTTATTTAATGTATTTATTAATTATPASVTVTVQPGYTLWGIAKRQMGQGVMYVQVWNANKSQIKNPDLIYPGQVFTMPQN